MPINKASLLTKLQTLVNTDYTVGSTKVVDLLSNALSTNGLNDINIITVSSVDTLPNLKYYDSPSGMLYYINDVGVFAISSGIKWLTLDGRLLRQDTLYQQPWFWGSNIYGIFGNNSTLNTSSPVLSTVIQFTDWCQVSVGNQHSLGLRTNGTLWAWGRTYRGRLGDNNAVNRSSPVSVVGGFTDWCQVGAGGIHSVGIRTNGTIWTWGSNSYGQLGDNTFSTSHKSSPVSVVGGFTDWFQVSAGCTHNLAIRSNGTLWGWGGNNQGQLGNNSCGGSAISPVSVVGGFTDWCQVSAGVCHSLGVRTNGTAWAWGNNCYGALGDNTSGSFNRKSSPVSVVGGFTDWCQVSAHGSITSAHSLGLRTNGTLWAWGANSLGQLGNNSSTIRNSPVSVIGGFTDWCGIATGDVQSFGLRTNGTLWAWGRNDSGQLGDGTITCRSSPVFVVGGFTDWGKISSGRDTAAGLRVKC